MTPQASSRSNDLQQLLERQQQTMDEVVPGLRTPQREYVTFYGEPRAFPLFMRNFEVNVEAKEENDAERLNYLIQYCGGKAREAIEHCIIMPPEEGYKRARKYCGRTSVAPMLLPKPSWIRSLEVLQSGHQIQRNYHSSPVIWKRVFLDQPS